MLLLALGAVTACSQPPHERYSVFSYYRRPSGYHWHQFDGHDGFYGVDPATAWTVYVGPDGTYYTFAHAPPIGPGDTTSVWNPHDASISARASAQRSVLFNYEHRPAGYRWQARLDPNGGIAGYYGTNPANHWTVYVGPDGIYYTFPHPPPIAPDDVKSQWNPHDASTVPKSSHSRR